MSTAGPNLAAGATTLLQSPRVAHVIGLLAISASSAGAESPRLVGSPRPADRDMPIAGLLHTPPVGTPPGVVVTTEPGTSIRLVPTPGQRPAIRNGPAGVTRSTTPGNGTVGKPGGFWAGLRGTVPVIGAALLYNVLIRPVVAPETLRRTWRAPIRGPTVFSQVPILAGHELEIRPGVEVNTVDYVMTEDKSGHESVVGVGLVLHANGSDWVLPPGSLEFGEHLYRVEDEDGRVRYSASRDGLTHRPLQLVAMETVEIDARVGLNAVGSAHKLRPKAEQPGKKEDGPLIGGRYISLVTETVDGVTYTYGVFPNGQRDFNPISVSRHRLFALRHSPNGKNSPPEIPGYTAHWVDIGMGHWLLIRDDVPNPLSTLARIRFESHTVDEFYQAVASADADAFAIDGAFAPVQVKHGDLSLTYLDDGRAVLTGDKGEIVLSARYAAMYQRLLENPGQAYSLAELQRGIPGQPLTPAGFKTRRQEIQKVSSGPIMHTVKGPPQVYRTEPSAKARRENSLYQRFGPLEVNFATSEIFVHGKRTKGETATAEFLRELLAAEGAPVFPDNKNHVTMLEQRLRAVDPEFEVFHPLTRDGDPRRTGYTLHPSILEPKIEVAEFAGARVEHVAGVYIFHWDDGQVRLPPTMGAGYFELLKHPGRVVSHQKIWGRNRDPEAVKDADLERIRHSVDGTMRKEFRALLRRAGLKPFELIESVFGRGYAARVDDPALRAQKGPSGISLFSKLGSLEYNLTSGHAYLNGEFVKLQPHGALLLHYLRMNTQPRTGRQAADDLNAILARFSERELNPALIGKLMRAVNGKFAEPLIRYDGAVYSLNLEAFGADSSLSKAR